jgi:hypothetical protein
MCVATSSGCGFLNLGRCSGTNVTTGVVDSRQGI